LETIPGNNVGECDEVCFEIFVVLLVFVHRVVVLVCVVSFLGANVEADCLVLVVFLVGLVSFEVEVFVDVVFVVDIVVVDSITGVEVEVNVSL